MLCDCDREGMLGMHRKIVAIILIGGCQNFVVMQTQGINASMRINSMWFACSLKIQLFKLSRTHQATLSPRDQLVCHRASFK